MGLKKVLMCMLLLTIFSSCSQTIQETPSKVMNYKSKLDDNDRYLFVSYIRNSMKPKINNSIREFIKDLKSLKENPVVTYKTTNKTTKESEPLVTDLTNRSLFIDTTNQVKKILKKW